MKKLKNTKGSTITTAVIVAMLVVILLAAIFGVSQLYRSNSRAQKSERQAYLYAKGECYVFANYLLNYQENKTYNPYYLAVGEKKIKVKDIKIKKKNTTDSDLDLEDSTVEISRKSENEMEYKATATVNGQTATVTLSCIKNDENWEKGSYK